MERAAGCAAKTRTVLSVPFNRSKWGDAFTGGNSLHTPGRFPGRAGADRGADGENGMDGNKAGRSIPMPPDFDDSIAVSPFTRSGEMQIVNMGNYAHGNSPFSMIYLYNYGRQPWKAQQKGSGSDGKSNCTRLTPDGYCGDEEIMGRLPPDVFSAMGFYPVTPTTTQYVINGSPLFDKVSLTLEDGKQFIT